MIGGWKATQVVSVSIGFVQTLGEEKVQEYISRRYEGDWLIQGPRGGRYIADAAQVTVWILDKAEFFVQGEWRYLGHRKDVRYVRPSSRDAARFDSRPVVGQFQDAGRPSRP
jgi:hypothetical protein